MSTFRNLSIKSKIMSIVMLTSCIALVAACAAMVVYEWFSFRTNLVLEMSSLAEITGKNCVVPVNYNRPEEAEEILAHLSLERQIQAACIYKNSKVWAKYANVPDQTAFPATPLNGQPRFDHGNLELSRPIIDEGKAIGSIYIRASLKTMYSRLGQYV